MDVLIYYEVWTTDNTSVTANLRQLYKKHFMTDNAALFFDILKK